MSTQRTRLLSDLDAYLGANLQTRGVATSAIVSRAAVSRAQRDRSAASLEQAGHELPKFFAR